ncbi:MAG: restriction endonuclease subunit S [Spirochaetaceae bacterium]|nr:restriction endonuclease subunit S [Spirochaetaceae bacterium]
MLGKLIDSDGGILQTGPFGSQLKQAEYSSDGVPVIMPTDIENGEVNKSTVARVPETTVERLSRHKMRAGGIVFPRRGAITKRAFIRPEQDGWLCGTGCIKIEVNGRRLWPRYLYYYLGLKDSIEWLERNAVGSTMLNLSTEIVSRFPIVCPSIPIQRRIADILSAYDNLIENNRRRISLLEQAARELYREWFVRLRFPGHESTRIFDGIPQGWERVALEHIGQLRYGRALKAEDRIDGDYPVYGSSGVVGTHNTPHVKGPGIIVGRKGNMGNVYWSDSDFCAIDTVYYMDPVAVTLFLYYTLENMDFINTDVAVPGLNRNLAHRRESLLPSVGLRDAFHKVAQSKHKQIALLRKENSSLEYARDLLLPRLMSGEVAV